jgi:hypothetical protein
LKDLKVLYTCTAQIASAKGPSAQQGSRPRGDAALILEEIAARQRGAASAPERISHNPEHVDSLTARLATEQREREERLERIRRKVEADKMKDCTFAPETVKQTPSTAEDKPLIVRGLGRYMELKQMAKRQSEAQKQREQKAFLIEPPSRLHPYTVPEPFVLHDKARRDERFERTRKEVEESRNAECTFTPKINEVSVRSLLRSSAG